MEVLHNQKPIGVAIVTYYFAPILAGHAVQMLEVAKALRAQEVNCTFIAANLMDAPAHEVINGSRVLRLRVPPESRWGYLIYVLKVIKQLWLERRTYEIIQFVSTKPFWFLILLFGKLTKKPVLLVATLAGSDDPAALKRKSFLWRIEGVSIQYVDRVICIASAIRDACQREHVLETKLVTIPCGVDLQLFEPVRDSESKCALRRKLGLPVDGFVVLFVGPVIRRKGCDTLFDAWEKVHQRHKNTTLVLVGPYGEDHITKEYSMVKAGDMGMMQEYRRRNILFAGLQEHEKVAQYMKCSDAFVLPSRAEGLPNVIMEAMACALPTIATRLPGRTDDLITDDVDGLLIEPGDAQTLAEKISGLIEDRQLYVRLSARAREKALTTFSIDRIAQRTKEMYEELLSNEK